MGIWDGAVTQSLVAGERKITEAAQTMVWKPITSAAGSVMRGVSGAVNSVENFARDAFGSTTKAVTDMIPKDFDAITSGQWGTSAQNALNDLGNSMSSSFESLSNNFTDSLTGSVGATEVSAMLGKAAKVSGGTQSFAVKLVSKVNPSDYVRFKVMPTISESRNASYSDVQIAHHPGVIIKYDHTSSRAWGLSQIKLISRTVAEATENQRTLNLMRSWLMPYYGYGTEIENKNMLGAPPDVLMFSAYGEQNIANIPVVLESMNFSWPNDVDYIHTDDMQPFPVILSIDIALKEAWSPREYSGFSLGAYKAGNMKAAYNAELSQQRPSSETALATTPEGKATPLAQVAPTKENASVLDAAKDKVASVKEAVSNAPTAVLNKAKEAVSSGVSEALGPWSNKVNTLASDAARGMGLQSLSTDLTDGKGRNMAEAIILKDNIKTAKANVEAIINKPKAYGRGHSN
jgi:hypothetical protein